MARKRSRERNKPSRRRGPGFGGTALLSCGFLPTRRPPWPLKPELPYLTFPSPQGHGEGRGYLVTPAAPEIRDQVKGPLLVQLAELDKRVNASWPEYEATLKKNGAAYTMHLYPGANHGFHNDSTGRHDKEQAELAWERTLAFFQKHLA